MDDISQISATLQTDSVKRTAHSRIFTHKRRSNKNPLKMWLRTVEWRGGKKKSTTHPSMVPMKQKNNNNIKFPSALTQAVWLYITICYKYIFFNLWVLKLSSLIFKYNTYEKWFWVVLLTANTTYRCVIEWQSHDYYYYWQVHFLVLPNWEKKVITVTKTQSAVLRHTLTTINNSNINKTHSEITQYEA